MVKIGAKLVKNNKIIKRYEYMNANAYSGSDFYRYVIDICNKLDIGAPIVIPYHRECYENFNSVKFFKDDFVDNVRFDYMFLENDDR